MCATSHKHSRRCHAAECGTKLWKLQQNTVTTHITRDMACAPLEKSELSAIANTNDKKMTTAKVYFIMYYIYAYSHV